MRKCIAVAVALITIVALFSLDGLALSGETFDENRKTEFLKNISLEFISGTEDKISIECFDVSDDGNIAILCNNTLLGEKRTVHVLNEKGDFKYGYTFNSDGTARVFFDGELLVIYHVRGNVAIWLDDRGQCVKAEEIKSNDEELHILEESEKTNREKNGSIYYLKSNNIFFTIITSSYSRIEKRTPSADNESEPEVMLIYQADDALNKNSGILLIFFLVLSIAAFLIIFFKVIKKKANSRTLCNK